MSRPVRQVTIVQLEGVTSVIRRAESALRHARRAYRVARGEKA